MPVWKTSEAAAILGVSADTVRRMVDAGTLRSVRTTGGQRRVDGMSLARHLATRDAVAGRRRSDAQSIRNRLPGIVLRVVRDRVAAQVEVQVGPHRMVSLITREAADALGLEPGMPATVSVKATNLAVEIPRAPAGRRHAD